LTTEDENSEHQSVSDRLCHRKTNLTKW